MSNAAGWFWALAIGAVVAANLPTNKDPPPHPAQPPYIAPPAASENSPKRDLLYVDQTLIPSKTSALPELTTYAPPKYDRPRFGDYPCTQDCSGHAAGYEWAEENGIEAADDCGGNSQSFIEGCEEYAEEQVNSYDYGQQWAEDNDIDDVSDCAGDGGAYDGCADYVEEQVDE